MNGNKQYLNEFGYFDPRSELDFVFPQESNTPSIKHPDGIKDNNTPDQTNVFLTSMKIFHHTNHEEEEHLRSLKVECQLWTRGFDRSFKVISC